MQQAIIVLAALAIGVCSTLVLVRARGWTGAPAERPGADDSTERLRLILEAQAAELRRLSDAEARRDLGGEQLRNDVLAFREALADLRVREQERRAREERGWQTLHRVSAVHRGR